MVVMVFNYVLTIAYSRPVSASLDFHHLCTFPQTVKVIHPKYYKHLKNVLTKPFGQTKNGLVSGRLACTSSKTEILNKIGI